MQRQKTITYLEKSIKDGFWKYFLRRLGGFLIIATVIAIWFGHGVLFTFVFVCLLSPLLWRNDHKKLEKLKTDTTIGYGDIAFPKGSAKRIFLATLVFCLVLGAAAYFNPIK